MSESGEEEIIRLLTRIAESLQNLESCVYQDYENGIRVRRTN